MKKIVLPALLVVAMSASSFAQIFIGGNMGFNSNSSSTTSTGTTTSGTTSKTTTTDIPGVKSTDFTLNPLVGYQLNEKFAVGVEAGFGVGSTTTPIPDPKVANTYKDIVTSRTSWQFAPFARYSVITVGKFSAMLHGSIGVSGKSESTPNETTAGTITTSSTKESSTFNFGIGIAPVVAYKLSDKWSIESYLNFASLSLITGSTTDKTTSSVSGTGVTASSSAAEDKISKTNFNFGVNNRLGVSAINIGFVYSL